MSDRIYDLYDVIEALKKYQEASDSRFGLYSDQQRVLEQMNAAQQQFIRAITYLIHEEDD